VEGRVTAEIVGWRKRKRRKRKIGEKKKNPLVL
jgi:hypothetical protein